MNPSASPLFDTLFRSTTGQAAGRDTPDDAARRGASAAPVRVAGTRTRAGNAMSRTRAALLVGAARAVATTGTRIAMAQVANLAGVAKATLYNHFRTRDAVLAALLLDQVQRVVETTRDKPLEVALHDAALSISRNEVTRGLAKIEPAALTGISRIDADAPAWQLARRGVSDVLDTAGRGGADTVLRWLASFVISPASSDVIRVDVQILVAGLPVATAADDTASARSA